MFGAKFFCLVECAPKQDKRQLTGFPFQVTQFPDFGATLSMKHQNGAQGGGTRGGGTSGESKFM